MPFTPNFSMSGFSTTTNINDLHDLNVNSPVNLYGLPYLDDAGNLAYYDSISQCRINDLTQAFDDEMRTAWQLALLGDIWGYVADQIGTPSILYCGTMFQSGTGAIPAIA